MKANRLKRAFIIALLVFVPAAATALDAPHTDVVTGYAITCSNCHWVHSSTMPPWTSVAYPDAKDDTINNRRCFSCHDSVQAPIEKVHSTTSTSSVYWSTLGGWTTECVTCHDPHKQNQTQVWGSATYIVTGPVSSAAMVPNGVTNETTITLGNTLTANYSGHYFIPDINSVAAGLPMTFFKIKPFTPPTSVITVKGIVNTAYLSATNTTYAVVYGENVKAAITKFANPAGTAMGGSVKLFNASGSFSAGDSANASTSVCYVCHTQTKHWSSIGDVTHNDKVDCTTCHAHTGGFKASCSGCHGNPPTTNNYVSPTGLVWTTITGSSTAGTHAAHVSTDKFACDACHLSSVGTGTTHNNRKITIGFGGLNAQTQGGAYGGQAGVSYDVTVTSPASSAPSGAAKTCGTVYCHGASMGVNGGSNQTPVWDNAATGACGTCHGASAASAPTLGSHTKHASSSAYGFNCNFCHPNVPAGDGLHVNADVAWSFSATDSRTSGALYNGFTTGSTAAKAPSVSYGVCTNLYCHSTGTAVPAYVQATWGSSGSGQCGTCHGVLAGTPPASVPHVKHVGTAANYKYSCSKCHDSVVNSTADSTTQAAIKSTSLHVNKTRDVAFDLWNTLGSYNGTNCNNIYCHSQGTGGTTGDVRPVLMPATLPTWSGSTNCGSCHGADATGRPVYANGTPKANSHALATHGAKTCDICHYPTTTNGSTIANAANHANKSYNIGGSGVVPSIMTYAYNAGGGSCSSSYCHGTAAIQWGLSGTLTCSSCHASMGAGGTVAYTGKHQTHVNTAGYDYSCEMCHSQNNGTLHVNGEVVANTQSAQVTFNNTGTGAFVGNLKYNGSWSTYKARSLTNNPYASEGLVSPVYTSTGNIVADGTLHWRDAGTCTNVWCHSNANPVGPGGVNSFSTPSWNTVMTCGSCHKTANTTANMQAAGTPSPMSATHVKHIATDQYGVNVNYTCNSCHNNTASNNTTLSSTANHVNGTKDVAFNAWVGGTACSNTYCHSNGAGGYTAAPVWTTTATAACGTCHGVLAGTPPASAPHVKHVGTAANYKYSCSKCHDSVVNSTADSTTPATIKSTSLHVNKTRDVAFDLWNTLGSYGANCNNIYCHSQGTGGTTQSGDTRGLAAPVIAAPAWSGAVVCNNCHGDGTRLDGMPNYTNNSPKANSHVKHVVSQSITCDKCHFLTTVNGTSIADATKHVNKSYEVAAGSGVTIGSYAYSATGGSCNTISCHGGGNATWGATLNCDGCHEAGLKQISGVHDKHWSTLAGNATSRWTTGNYSTAAYYQFQCGTCHAAGTHITGGNSLADVGFNISWATGNTGGWYTVGTGNSTDSRGLRISVNGTCNNIYCHSSGIAPGASGPTYKAVVWNTVSSGCNFCHAASPATNAHTTHATTYSYGCVECHAGTVSNNSTISNKANHVNFVNNVYWNSLGYNNGGGVYASSAAYACSNIYCHSQGQAGVAPYNSAGNTPNVTAVWTSVGKLGTECTGCHNGDSTATGGLIMNTYKHTQHVNNAAVNGVNYTCDICHKDTVAAGQNRTLNAVTGTAKHVNKEVNVVFTALNSAGVYTGSLTPGDAVGTCQTAYCHSIGNLNVPNSQLPAGWTTLYRNPAWNGAAISCNGCHGPSTASGYPDYATGLAGSVSANSHPKHSGTGAGQSNINCSLCHNQVTTNGTAINGATPSLHINGITQNVDFAASQSGAGYTAVYNAGTKTCNNFYCHSNVQGATGSGSPSTFASPQWGGSTNCGSCHLNMATDPTGTGSHKLHAGTTGNAQYTCSYCHGGNYTASSVDTALHVNKTINLSWTTNAVGTTYSKTTSFAAGSAAYGNCSTNRCHGSGTPTWGNATARTTCEKCHGSAASIAVDGGFRDTAGSTLDTGAKTGAHAVHLGAWHTISNPIACSECHSSPANVTDFSTHMNGSTTFTWGALATTNLAVPVYTAPVCSNTYCHFGKSFGGYAPATPNAAVSWTSTSYLTGVPSLAGDCGKCHQSPPSTTGSHTGVTNINQCTTCHTHVNADGTFNDKSKHIDGIVQGGDCASCHDYDAVGATYTAGVWTGGTWGKNPKGVEGYGAHVKHINHIKTRLSIATVMSPTGQSFGLGDARRVCGTCHTNSTANHETSFGGGAGGTRVINFGDSQYKEGYDGAAGGTSFLFDPAAPTTNPPKYNGVSGSSSSVSPKTCSAVGCHYATTPVWGTY